MLRWRAVAAPGRCEAAAPLVAPAWQVFDSSYLFSGRINTRTTQCQARGRQRCVRCLQHTGLQQLAHGRATAGATPLPPQTTFRVPTAVDGAAVTVKLGCCALPPTTTAWVVALRSASGTPANSYDWRALGAGLHPQLNNVGYGGVLKITSAGPEFRGTAPPNPALQLLASTFIYPAVPT